MNEINLTNLLLTELVAYGPPLFGLALLIAALGLPLPGTLLVLATGAFIRQGVLNGVTMTVLGLIGVVLGDSLSYALGRFAHQWALRRFGGTPAWQQAQSTFDRRGGLAIYLTRFFLTPLATPTNLIAGSSGYAFWRFLAFDSSGEATWLVLFGGMGYLAGSQWELVNQLASNFTGLLTGLVVLGAGGYGLLRLRQRIVRQRWQPVTSDNLPDVGLA